MALCLAGEKKVKQMSKIKGKVWGFQKKEVEDYINKLKKAQEAELKELSKKNENVQRENEILRLELSTLTETNASFPAGILLELALNRVERVSGYIDQDVDIEVLAIDKITHQKSLVLENTIAELEKNIEKEKEIIEIELKNIVDIAKGQERTKNIDIDVIKNLGKLLPIADWLKSNREEQTNLGKEFWEEESTDSTQELIKQMTADGTVLEPMIKPDTTNANIADQNAKRNSSSEHQVSANVMKADSREGKDNKDNKADVDSILGSSQKGNPENVNPYFSVSKTDFWDVSVGGEDNTNPCIQEVAVTADSETKAASQDFYQSMETSEVQAVENPSGQSQAGVREEISAVRAKYILGKVAGVDIMDTAGQVIIRKGEPITVSFMQMAQNEGKLADLIINMELPRQEE